MNISRMFNHLFSSNKKMEINTVQNKKKENSDSRIDIRQIALNNISATGQDADLALKKIEEQISKQNNPHQLNANRITAILGGEKTGRLDSFRMEVLKNVIGEENQKALIQDQTMGQLKSLISQKKA